MIAKPKNRNSSRQHKTVLLEQQQQQQTTKMAAKKLQHVYLFTICNGKTLLKDIYELFKVCTGAFDACTVKAIGKTKTFQ